MQFQGDFSRESGDVRGQFTAVVEKGCLASRAQAVLRQGNQHDRQVLGGNSDLLTAVKKNEVFAIRVWPQGDPFAVVGAGLGGSGCRGMKQRTNQQIDLRGARHAERNPRLLRMPPAGHDLPRQHPDQRSDDFAVGNFGPAILDFYMERTLTLHQRNSHALTALPLLPIAVGMPQNEALGDLRVFTSQAEVGLLGAGVARLDRNRAEQRSLGHENHPLGFDRQFRLYARGRADRGRERVGGKVIRRLQIAGIGQQQFPRSRQADGGIGSRKIAIERGEGGVDGTNRRPPVIALTARVQLLVLRGYQAGQISFQFGMFCGVRPPWTPTLRVLVFAFLVVLVPAAVLLVQQRDFLQGRIERTPGLQDSASATRLGKKGVDSSTSTSAAERLASIRCPIVSSDFVSGRARRASFSQKLCKACRRSRTFLDHVGELRPDLGLCRRRQDPVEFVAEREHAAMSSLRFFSRSANCG